MSVFKILVVLVIGENIVLPVMGVLYETVTVVVTLPLIKILESGSNSHKPP